MALALSPFPATTAAVARAAAIACIKAGIVDGGGLSDERGGALGEAAAAAVERFAPDAPQAARNEAVLRLAGWLLASRARAQRSTRIDILQVQYQIPRGSNGFQLSGARELLLPWRTRRALPVEDDS